MNEFGFDFFKQLQERFPDLDAKYSDSLESKDSLENIWFKNFSDTYLLPKLTLVYMPLIVSNLTSKLRQASAECSDNVKQLLSSLCDYIEKNKAQVLDEGFSQQLCDQLEKATGLNVEQRDDLKATVKFLVSQTIQEIQEKIKSASDFKQAESEIMSALVSAYAANTALNQSIEKSIKNYTKAAGSAPEKKQERLKQLEDGLDGEVATGKRQTIWETFSKKHPNDSSTFGYMLRQSINAQSTNIPKIAEHLDSCAALINQLQSSCQGEVVDALVQIEHIEREKMRQSSFQVLSRLTLESAAAATLLTQKPEQIVDNVANQLGYHPSVSATSVSSPSIQQLSDPPLRTEPEAVVVGTNLNTLGSSVIMGELLNLSGEQDIEGEINRVCAWILNSSAPRFFFEKLNASYQVQFKFYIEKSLAKSSLQWNQVLQLHELFSKDDFDVIEAQRVAYINSITDQHIKESRQQEEIDGIVEFMSNMPLRYSLYSIFLQGVVRRYPNYLTEGVFNKLETLPGLSSKQIATSTWTQEGKSDKDMKIKRSFVKIQLIYRDLVQVKGGTIKEKLAGLLLDEFKTLSKIVSVHRGYHLFSKPDSEKALIKFLSAPEQAGYRDALKIKVTSDDKAAITTAVESFLDRCKKGDVQENDSSAPQSTPGR